MFTALALLVPAIACDPAPDDGSDDAAEASTGGDDGGDATGGDDDSADGVADDAADDGSAEGDDAADDGQIDEGDDGDDGSTGPGDTTGGSDDACLEGELGIWECDQYLAAYVECIDEQFPKGAQQAALDAAEESCDAWQMVVDDDGDIEALADACQQSAIALADTCGWVGSCEGACDSSRGVEAGPLTCFCDAECLDLGDCCSDYEALCGG